MTDTLGPDSYGYYIYDQNDDYELAPEYNWIEIDPGDGGAGDELDNINDNGDNNTDSDTDNDTNNDTNIDTNNDTNNDANNDENDNVDKEYFLCQHQVAFVEWLPETEVIQYLLRFLPPQQYQHQPPLQKAKLNA